MVKSGDPAYCKNTAFPQYFCEKLLSLPTSDIIGADVVLPLDDRVSLGNVVHTKRVSIAGLDQIVPPTIVQGFYSPKSFALLSCFFVGDFEL